MSKYTLIERIIYAALNPNTWVRNYAACKHWDEALNRLMDTHTFTDYDGYSASLGRCRIWVENHPYASFHKRDMCALPFRITSDRALAKLIREVIIAQ